MPEWFNELKGFGPLGLFALFFFGVALPAIWKQLFSRDEKSLGLVVMKVRSSCAKDEKMGQFIDQLSARDDRQEKFCEMHAKNLEGVAGVLGVHHTLSSDTNKGVSGLKEAALVGCQACRVFVEREHPNSKAEMEPYLSRIEKIIGEA